MPKTHKAIHADKEQRKSQKEIITEGFMVRSRDKNSARKKAERVVKEKASRQRGGTAHP